MPALVFKYPARIKQANVIMARKRTNPAGASGHCQCPGGWSPCPHHHLWSRSPTT